jgi:Ca2+-binding EF-hand superfamily protein
MAWPLLPPDAEAEPAFPTIPTTRLFQEDAMTYRKLSILAAAVALGLSAGAGAQTTNPQTTPPPVSSPPSTIPPDTTPPIGTTSDPLDPMDPTMDQSTHGATVSEVARQNRLRHVPPGQIKPFSELDTDGDGFIASIDLDTSSPIRDRFDEFDLDSDGKLSSTEYQAWVAEVTAPPGQTVRQVAHGQRDFRALDSNNDGFISRIDVEVGSDLATNFDQYDLDNDGRLSRTEFDAYLAASVEISTFDSTVGTSSTLDTTGATTTTDTTGAAITTDTTGATSITDTTGTTTSTTTGATTGTTTGTMTGSMAMQQKSFSEIDSNSDGLLSKSELQAAGSALAAEVDANETLTRSEYEQWVAESDDDD